MILSISFNFLNTLLLISSHKLKTKAVKETLGQSAEVAP